MFRMRTYLEAGTVEDVIPEGYIHAFLMRHPKKCVPSIYNGTLQGFSGKSKRYLTFKFHMKLETLTDRYCFFGPCL